MLTEHDRRDGDIAGAGLTGRFLGASTIQLFWHNLCRGMRSIHSSNQQKLEALCIEDPVLRDPHYVKASAVMDGVELFDVAFFG